MKAFVPLSRSPFQSYVRSPALSTTLHVLALAAIGWAAWLGPRVIPEPKQPGTSHGNVLLSYYSLGSPLKAASTVKPKIEKPKDPVIAAPPAPQETKGPASEKPTASTGSGDSTQSGLGDGDISFAMQLVFTPPKPDLSTLEHGRSGDVILDAVIDESGKVAKLTLVKGLTPEINQSVIATVQNWTYKPATKNGVAVASEQELHFHYARA